MTYRAPSPDPRMPPNEGGSEKRAPERRGVAMPPDEGVRKDEGVRSTAGCVEGSSAILRLVNEILSDALSKAENEARTATFAASVSESHKS